MLKTHPVYKRLLFGKLETESRSEEKTKMKRNGLKISKQKPYSFHCRKKKIEKFFRRISNTTGRGPFKHG